MLRGLEDSGTRNRNNRVSNIRRSESQISILIHLYAIYSKFQAPYNVTKIIQPLYRANLLFRPQHPSAGDSKFDSTGNPKRNLHPRVFRNEAPSNSTNKDPNECKNPSVPLYVFSERPQEGRISRNIMQHTCQDHRGHFRQP